MHKDATRGAQIEASVAGFRLRPPGWRTVCINRWGSLKSAPQGLKPRCLLAIPGTTEVVPFHEAIRAVSSRFPARLKSCPFTLWLTKHQCAFFSKLRNPVLARSG